MSIVSGMFVLAAAMSLPLAMLMILHQFCKDTLGFWPYAALPLGSGVPWLGALVIVAALSPFVADAKQAGFGFTPFILLLGSGLLFVATAFWGAFYGLNPSSFSSRFLLGARISLVFALGATLWIVYLGFFEGR
ncbi:MAG: hypothetical protein EA403_16220 [Spirochaetaceae bacterium]|nr:MAG: hypothetical protein EA403_16220 [Spirochaetaceae bacterium]